MSLHARSLLATMPEGTTAYIEARPAQSEDILEQAAATLDLTTPVAVMLLGSCITSKTPTIPGGSWLAS